MLARLKIVEGRPAAASVPVRSGRILIGAEPGCDLRPWDSTVADRHCEVLGRGDRVLVRDLGSDRGTLVNGLRIAPVCLARIRPGDRVRVGETVFELEGEDSPAGEDGGGPTAKAATGLLQRRLGAGPRAAGLEGTYLSSGRLEGVPVHRVELTSVESRAEVAVWRLVLGGLADRADGGRMILDLGAIRTLSLEAAAVLRAFQDRASRRGTAVKICQATPPVLVTLAEVEDPAGYGVFLDAQMAVWSAW